MYLERAWNMNLQKPYVCTPLLFPSPPAPHSFYSSKSITMLLIKVGYLRTTPNATATGQADKFLPFIINKTSYIDNILVDFQKMTLTIHNPAVR
jgi:hypothetical protein